MKCSISLLLLTFVGLSLTTYGTDKPKPETPKREINPSLTPIEDKDGLPRILLIGDSISMGYTLPVRQQLEGKANVHRIPQNGGPTSNGIKNIDKWLGDKKWDIIHFNWGIHDLKIMPGGNRQVEFTEYENNLRKLVARLKDTKAELIWATTTPIPEGALIPDRRFGKVSEYNEIANRVMNENKVTINDLNAWITPKLNEMQKTHDLHYNESGSEYLGQKVAVEIQAVIAKMKSSK